MNLLYCGDRNIADGVFLSVLSVLEYTEAPLHVYLLTASYEEKCVALGEDFSGRLRRHIEAVRPGSTVTLTDISEIFAAEPPTANQNTRFTPCCMLRLYADLCPELPDRILYLDNDVLCGGDPSALWSMDLEGFELAGVLDRYGSWFFRRRVFCRDYLNSGVLLLNLAEIRKTGLFARCRKRCAEKEMLLPDQSALNKLTTAKKRLDRRYNEQKRTSDTTVFRHFTTFFRFFPRFEAVSVKPWCRERMHGILKDHAFDGILDRYDAIKSNYEKETISYETK